jgi:hypothetical protein
MVINFKVYKCYVIEQAIDTAALMLGSVKSRGYCLKMIFANFLAVANLQEDGDSELLYVAFMRLNGMLG